MILDIIFIVLLLVILGVILFAVRFLTLIKQKQEELVQLGESRYLPKVITDFEKIRSEFIAYIERESCILQCDSNDGAYIRYDAGYPRMNGLLPVWIQAWIPDNQVPQNNNKISAVISIKGDSSYFTSHYEHLKEHRSKVQQTFFFETIDLQKVGGNIYQLRVEKKGVDLTQTANWEKEFRWLRENLEKLYWVLRVRDQLGWDRSS